MKPHVINFHITDACNYRCRHCFAHYKMNDMPLSQTKKVIDSIEAYFAENGIIGGRINIAGGEPLLYRHLDEIIDYISEKRIKASIITNGSQLTPKRVASWSGKVDMIGISIDAVTPEVNAKIGRCNKHGEANTKDHLMSLAKAIHESGIRLKINTVVSKTNLGEYMLPLYQAMKPNRLKLICVHVVRNINGFCENEKILPSIDEFNAFCEKNRYEENCELVCEEPREMENSYFMINPHGEVYMNCNGVEKKYGSSVGESLTDIFSRLPFDAKKYKMRYAV